MKTLKNITPLLMTAAAIFALTFSACNKDGDKSEMRIQMTDAPADDANVQGVFVTVAEVSIDGEPVEGFEKQTIEISSYTEGRSKLIFSDDVEIGNYNNLSLTFDYKEDADGNEPGCYVKSTDGNKHNLKSSGEATGEFTFNQDFQVAENNSDEIIIDMDLRKCVQRESNGNGSDDYEFVAKGHMQSSFRTAKTESTGTVKGQFQSSKYDDYDKVVVYAYKRGTYSSSETEADSETNLRYRNCTTSGTVNNNGEYTLAFVEEGEYEVVVAAYNYNSEGETQFEGELEVDLLFNGGLVNTFDVSAQSTTTLNLKLL